MIHLGGAERGAEGKAGGFLAAKQVLRGVGAVEQSSIYSVNYILSHPPLAPFALRWQDSICEAEGRN